MTTTFLNLPPHLLPSSTPPLSGTPSGQNTSTPPHLHTSTPPYLHTSSPPHLHSSSPPPLSGTPSGQNTSSPPQLHHSLAPQVAPTLLSGGPSGALWRPKCRPQVSLSGASRGNLHCSLAPSNGRSPKFLFYTTDTHTKKIYVQRRSN